jgi:hypothetical protein
MMKTVTFYSIKEDPSRSVIMLICALKLCQSGKRIAILECNVAAPTLVRTVKEAGRRFIHIAERGLVDYLLFYQDIGQASDRVEQYVSTIHSPMSKNNLFLVAGGNDSIKRHIPEAIAIDWRRLFPEKGLSSGVGLILHLKKSLEETYRPDFLLIDAGAGITDLSVLSLRGCITDTVMCLCEDREIAPTKKTLLQISGKRTDEKSPEILFNPNGKEVWNET